MGRIFFLSLLKNCNHKRLGIYYLLSAFIFGISGTLVSVLLRIELYSSGNRIISPENQNFYNISITLHGFLMIRRSMEKRLLALRNYYLHLPVLSLFHLVSTFIGILLTFSPMHFLGFNVMPRRIPDFPDSFHSWNFLSSIGSGITFLSFAIFIP